MSAKIVNIFRVENEVGAPIQVEFKDTDLTGFTITTHIKYSSGGKLVRAATITDALNGLFQFAFISGDLKTGEHKLEFEFNDGVGGLFTLPRQNSMNLIVRKEIA